MFLFFLFPTTLLLTLFVADCWFFLPPLHGHGFVFICRPHATLQPQQQQRTKTSKTLNNRNYRIFPFFFIIVVVYSLVIFLVLISLSFHTEKSVVGGDGRRTDGKTQR